jgi:choline dehydrogenase-like flavoprotein
VGAGVDAAATNRWPSCRPLSRGSVTLASADPLAAPVIDPNYLDHPQDVEDIRKVGVDRRGPAAGTAPNGQIGVGRTGWGQGGAR